MKLLFKTLRGNTFNLDADESETISQLKVKVGQDQGYDDPASCKLIFSGKVLKDADTLAQVAVTPEKFLVVMPPAKKAALKKPPPAETTPATPAAASAVVDRTPAVAPAIATPAAPAAAPVAVPEAAQPAQPAAGDPAANPAAPATAATDAPTAGAGSGAGLVMGAELEATIKNICEMGFEEAQVRRAMRASFHNPERAIDYLFNGIPEAAEAAVSQPASQAAGQVAPSTVVQPQGHAQQPAPVESNQPFNMFAPQPAAPSPAGAPGNLDFLRGLPQFSLMRRAIQQDPTVLQNLLEQLASTNPALLNLIQANQAEFDRLIQEPLSAEDEMLAHAEATEAMNELQRAEGMGGPPPGSNFVEVNEEERQQIERLEELVGPMGLNRNAVLRAWLACDKNEELAANYLLNNLEDVLADQREAEGDADDSGERQD